ncbi:hypothetical protein EJB05_27984, partial [Eragrostis curvula]
CSSVLYVSDMHISRASNNEPDLCLQLRNFVWATSKHDVYFMLHYSVVHWSALSGVDTEILNFQGRMAPKEHLDQEGISFCCQTTYDDNAIMNAVEIFNTSSGAVHFIASNNDSSVRDYDMERFQLCKHFQFEWPVNVSSFGFFPVFPFSLFGTSPSMTSLLHIFIFQHMVVKIHP